MYIYSKKHLQKPLLYILDRMAIVSALGAAFVRLGNFFNSEIYGKPTGSNLGVIFKSKDAEMLPRHPTQLYEALCYLILFIVLWKFYWKIFYRIFQRSANRWKRRLGSKLLKYRSSLKHTSNINWLLVSI